jgi:CubicO group peptidase (beta-lactamase class C family)
MITITNFPKNSELFNSTIGFILIIFIVSTLFPQKLQAQSEIKEKLDKMLNGFPQKAPGGVVVVLENNNILYSGTYGLANLEWNIPNATDIKYRIGSLTKTFTAIAILQLEDEKKLTLQDKVKTWLPELDIDDRITIGNLLSHTSGIQSNSKDPGFLPGERMNYSNYGYILLGQIISKCSGTTYDNYIKEHIFKPLGMNDSGYEHSNEIITRKASGYRFVQNGVIPAPYFDMEGPGAAGGLYSTANDLILFEKALSGTSGIDKSILEKAFTPYKLNDGKESTYGLGWMVRNYKGWREVSHGGDIEGFNCYFAHFPDHQRSVIVLQNVKMQLGAPWAEAGRLVNLIVDFLWEKELRTEVQTVTEIKVSEEKLNQLTGVYEFENAPVEMIAIVGSKLTVTTEDGKLYVQDKNNRAAVIALSENEFAATGVDIRLRFNSAEGKRATGLVYNLMGLREIKARLIQ